MRTLRVAVALCAAALLQNRSPLQAQVVAQWTQFLGNDAHSSYSADPAISVSAASSIGVKWMANLYDADLGSPVVAYNSTLNREVVYVGDQRADAFAVDAGTGQELWSTNLGYGDRITSTPAVASDGSVWVATNYNATLYKLDGSTGTVNCSVKGPGGAGIQGSAMLAAPSGSENVYWIENDSNTSSGPMMATSESSCAQVYEFVGYREVAGGWATPVFGTTAKGEAIVIDGTSDPDSTVYAVDANTGALVWEYETYNPSPSTYDVGDGATASAPGINGFADGVVYVNNKYGIEYALDLTTGNQIWQYDLYPANYGGNRLTISSAALDGNQLVLGYANGITALNATTGAMLWNQAAPAEVASSPAIIGPSGSEIIAFADLTGAFRVYSLSSGSQLYSYQTGGYVTSSAADYNGTVYIASSDGFLYAFTPGGGNGSAPVSTVSAPNNDSTVPNPNGSLVIAGSSSDAKGVSVVEIAVQENGPSGSWYDAAANSWNSAPVRNEATLANPGAKSSGWNFSLPVPASGGSYEVFATTINSSHIAGRNAASSFTVSRSSTEPNMTTSVTYIAPGGTFGAMARGFQPNETVTFSLLGGTVATATASTKGIVPRTKIQVPSAAAFGPTSLTATGSASGYSTSTTIYVSNAWTQFGYSALRTGAEPSDPIITGAISVGPNTLLDPSWVYQSNGAINTQPAIANGIAYFGNDAGTFTAVYTQSGSPLWTYSIPSGAEIRSSPAVDASRQLIFGANDGNLYVLSSAGAALKTLGLGGNIGPPAYADDAIVVASSSGTVYSIADPAWTTNWSANLGASIQMAPVLDTKAGLVIVGNSSGTVTALSASSGTSTWTATTGGAITGAIVEDGDVYVASADGNLYELKEATGKSVARFKGDGPVSAVSIGTSNNIAFGTSTGAVFVTRSGGAKRVGSFGSSAITGLSSVPENVLASNQGGSLGLWRTSGASWEHQTGSSLSVPPAIINGTVYLGAADGNLYAFSPYGATPLSSVHVGPLTVTITSGTCPPNSNPI